MIENALVDAVTQVFNSRDAIYAVMPYIAAAASSLALVVAIRSREWRAGTDVDRLLLLGAVVGTAAILALAAIYARVSIGFVAAMLDLNGVIRLADETIGCPSHTDCYIDVIALWVYLTMAFPPAFFLYVGGLLVTFRARGKRRIWGIVLFVPVLLVAALGVVTLRAQALSASGPTSGRAFVSRIAPAGTGAILCGVTRYQETRTGY